MADPILSITGLYAGYGATEILRGIEHDVAPGEIVAVLGSNGAGKSTLNRAISGVLRPWRGAIRFDGAQTERAKPSAIVSLGLIQVPEGRRIFPNMTVAENLDLGCYRRARARRAENRERVYGVFPRLKERATQLAGTLSGGEQQMLAMGRALMARPKVLLMDEPSMGLAPIMVDKIFEVVGDIHSRGTTILLVEQNASRALQLANRGYVMESGEITMSGQSKALLDDPKVRAAYLGE